MWTYTPVRIADFEEVINNRFLIGEHFFKFEV
jgi:hypothetical protein